MQPTTVIEHAGFRIEISPAVDPPNPRTEWDNLGTMVCFHGRYRLGDDPDQHSYRSEDYHCWEELQAAIQGNNPGCALLPVYLYDHSGLTVNTTGFSCPWDSGQIGFIFAGEAAIRTNFGVSAVTEAVWDQALEVLRGEVETYDQYLQGDIYCYDIKRPDPDDDGEETGEGEVLDSCCGFYGEGSCLEEAKAAAEALAGDPTA